MYRVRELKTLPDVMKGISYNGEHIQTTGSYDSMANLAERRKKALFFYSKKRLSILIAIYYNGIV